MFSIMGTLLYRLPAVDSMRTHFLGPALPFFRVVSVAQDAAVRIARGDESGESRASLAAAAFGSHWSSSRITELEREVNELRSLMNVAPLPNVRGVVAMVSANPSLSGGRTLLIDKGSDDGVATGAIVLAPVENGAAVIGRVESSTGNLARVRTILDPSVRVAARVPWCAGLVYSGKSDGWGGRLEYVSQDKVVQAGDTVTTSADGTLYPDGLLLGKVTRVTAGPGPFQVVDVDPAAPIGSLRHVWVVSSGNDTGPSSK